MPKYVVRNLILFFLVLIGVGVAFSTLSLSGGKPKDVDLSTLAKQIQQDEVKSIDIQGNEISATLNDGTKEKTVKESGDSLVSALRDFGVEAEKLQGVEIAVKQPGGFSYWASVLLPIILPFLLIGGFIYLMMRNVQGQNMRAMMFGQSSAREVPKDGKNRVTFKEVAGVKEAKEELAEVVDFLRNLKKFTAVGAKIPKGVLLMGSPGTGKTLLARAVAGEANVPFLHISGSEFVEMFVGVGASRVRDLFAKAKKTAPCIIFIDEIDAVGRQRGAGLGGSHDEREQTLNQILTEMDGFEPNAGVIVLAATNRPDVLDPALLRPGRFDRRVVIDPPDLNDREEILKIHAKKKPLAADVNLRKLAERTPGFSGADLANLMNEAAILAARKDKTEVSEAMLLDSVEKVMLGPERKSYVMNDHEKKVTAYHEAGHALVAHFSKHADPVHKISIISRGFAAGYTIKLPTEDKRMHTKSEFIDDIAVMLGGYVAEREIFNELTTGASSDLRKATSLAKDMVTRFGMSDVLPPRTYGEHEEMIFLGKEIHSQRDYSEKIAQQIDEEVAALIQNGKAQAEKVVREQRAKMDKVVEVLLKNETIEKEEFAALMAA
ncbi:MAG: ATP-dependent zinc metalloprotease FtsH [Patescibacteria group bacterium]|nr:MAG: ATP-dependent zinc metalloprotease FtsH [Patescibacteria group bacterium]